MTAEHFILSTTCPHCGKENQLASGIEEASFEAPTAGAMSMCITCGCWGVFDDELVLRQPTVVEYEIILHSMNTLKLSAAWLQLNADRQRTFFEQLAEVHEIVEEANG